jgi:signal transduction histidine kinase
LGDVDGGAGTVEPTGSRPGHEQILSDVAASLLAAEGDALGPSIDLALARLAEAFDADRAYILAFEEHGAVVLDSEWCRPGIDAVGADFARMGPTIGGWWATRVLVDQPIIVRTLDEVGSPDDPAGLEARALLAEEGVSGLLLVPIAVRGRPRGAVGLSVVGRPYPFGDDVPLLLQLTGQLVVNRLERARAEDAVTAITAELARRNVDLERSNRQLEEFAYVASHDLKSPLLVVRGFLDLLEREKGGPLSGEAREFVAAAIRGATRMERLIDDLLAYSRVGQRPLEIEDVDLAELVAWVLEDCRVLLDTAGATVDVGRLPVVRADRTQLAQVVQNLIGNAVKFARLDVTLHIAVAAERRGRDWVVSVRDNGVGIPKEDRLKVFGMFARLDATADRPGSGIGLAIAERVIEAHGGRLWIADTPGEVGTTFCFSLPA